MGSLEKWRVRQHDARPDDRAAVAAVARGGLRSEPRGAVKMKRLARAPQFE